MSDENEAAYEDRPARVRPRATVRQLQEHIFWVCERLNIDEGMTNKEQKTTARKLQQLLLGAPTQLWDDTRAEAAEARSAELEARVGELEAAVKWALPLACLCLEDIKLKRLEVGHDDIGKGKHPGLWPEEIAARDGARQALSASHAPIGEAKRAVVEAAMFDFNTGYMSPGNLETKCGLLAKLESGQEESGCIHEWRMMSGPSGDMWCEKCGDVRHGDKP